MQCVAMQYNAIQCAALHHQLPMLCQFVFTLQYLEVWIAIQSLVLFMCLSPLNNIRIIGIKCTCDCAGDTDNHCNCNLKFMLFQVVANNLNQKCASECWIIGFDTSWSCSYEKYRSNPIFWKCRCSSSATFSVQLLQLLLLLLLLLLLQLLLLYCRLCCCHCSSLFYCIAS